MFLLEGQHRNRTACPVDVERHERLGNFTRIEDRRIVAALRPLEDVAEAPRHRRQRLMIGMHVDALAHCQHQGAQIVDAVQLVGMFMGDEDAVQMGGARSDQLLAHVRRGVDQHRGLALRRAPPHQDRAAPAPVLRFGRIADAPIAGPVWPANARHPARGAGAQNGDMEVIAPVLAQWGRSARLNSLKKLSVVALASASALTPLSSASTAAVLAT